MGPNACLLDCRVRAGKVKWGGGLYSASETLQTRPIAVFGGFRV